jgi:hypothetical protein
MASGTIIGDSLPVDFRTGRSGHATVRHAGHHGDQFVAAAHPSARPRAALIQAILSLL